MSEDKEDFGNLFTSKQREIFELSVRLGYYDFPRNLNLNELAGKIGITPSTLCVHLQKIESKVFGFMGRFL